MLQFAGHEGPGAPEHCRCLGVERGTVEIERGVAIGVVKADERATQLNDRSDQQAVGPTRQPA